MREPINLPVGRATFGGTIRKIKLRKMRAAPHLPLRTVHFALIRATHGWQVYGALPREAVGLKPGQYVRLTATITRQSDDFGFFHRPTREKVQANENQIRIGHAATSQ